MKQGTPVIVRTYGGLPAIKRLWDVAHGCVYICSERQYDLLVMGEEAPPPIAFPCNDVYRFNEKTANAINEGLSPDLSELDLVTACV